MHPLRLFALVALAAPAAAMAGVRFDLSTEFSGSEGYSYRGRMIIDGNRTRIDVTEGSHPLFNPNFTILTRDRGAEIVVLDHVRRTYFSRKTAAMSGHLSTIRGIGKSDARRPRIHSAHRDGAFVLTATYGLANEVEGEHFQGTVEMDVRIETHPDARQHALPWGLLFAVKSGYEGVDRALARRLTDRLPTKQVVTVT
ncbi:MAG TPA: hypothetical protein VF111_14630, partial [Thermoanaerobaculia bacterium]